MLSFSGNKPGIMQLIYFSKSRESLKAAAAGEPTWVSQQLPVVQTAVCCLLLWWSDGTKLIPKRKRSFLNRFIRRRRKKKKRKYRGWRRHGEEWGKLEGLWELSWASFLPSFFNWRSTWPFEGKAHPVKCHPKGFFYNQLNTPLNCKHL